MRSPSILRRPVLALALAASAACGTGPELPSGPPFGPNDIVFRLEPGLLGYFFIDTSSVGTQQLSITLRWLADTTFSGFNCIGFAPRNGTEPIGTFQFYYEGPNQGLLERTTPANIDTVVGLLLTGLEGTRGNYSIDTTTNRVTLFWADAGAEARYFDPSADIRFSGDTLRSTADLSAKADSIRAQWDVSWVRNDCAF